MTDQIPDSLLLKGTGYAIIGAQGSGLPAPRDFGLQPRALSSACWRGYIRAFKTRKGRLFLDRLTVKDDADRYPPINGIGPVGNRPRGACYKKLELPAAFTGLLRIGRDVACPVPMGWSRPEGFRTVLDISLDGGRVTEIRDRSEDPGGSERPLLPDAEDFEIPDFLLHD